MVSEALVVQLTFLAAAVVFGVAWALRRAIEGRRPSIRELSAEDAALYAPGGQLPPPLPAPVEPYAAPAEFPGVAVSGPAAGRGIPVDWYRFLDLPLIGLVFLIFFSLTGMPGGQEEVPLEQKYRPDVLIFAMVFHVTMMGMVCAFMCRRASPGEWLGLRWRQWPLAFAIAPVTVFAMWCVMGVLHFSGWNEWLQRALGADGLQESVRLLMETQDPAIIVLMSLAAVVVAPVAEEVVFRGYLYPAAKRFCGGAGAVVFSSLVFAAAHGSAMALLPLFILAVVLCLLYEATGSIWAPVSVHFLFNGATVGIQLLARSGLVDVPAE